MIAAMTQSMPRRSRAALIATGLIALSSVLLAQTPSSAPAAAGKPPVHAQAVKRLRITNAMVIPGTGVPAYGPVDILVEDGLIARVGNDPNKRWPASDATIDATGKYVMPGIVNTHMHWHEERSGRSRFNTSAICTSPPA
jgi:imidazolonepropionase-like amidohydrolase